MCDGYDGEGLFHIDWGWAGQDNGYYSLSVLNPFLTAIPDTASTSAPSSPPSLAST